MLCRTLRRRSGGKNKACSPLQRRREHLRKRRGDWPFKSSSWTIPRRSWVYETSSLHCETEFACRPHSWHPETGVFAIFRAALELRRCLLVLVWLRISKHIPCLRVLIDTCGWRCVVQVLEDEFSSRPHLGNLHGQHHAARTLLSRRTSDVQQCRRLDCASVCSELSNGVGKTCSSDNPKARPSTCPPWDGATRVRSRGTTTAEDKG